MTATLVKIHSRKFSRNPGTIYQRLSLQLEDGSFATTDVVSTFRNYARWRPVIAAGIGTKISGVRMLAAGKVDADSPVRAYQEMMV